MKILNHLLFFDNETQVKFKRTPNHGGVKKSFKYLIIHYDAASGKEGLNWMLNDKSDVSAEIWIGRDGEIVQLLELNLTAWHAGESSWKGLNGLNSHSIGIEMQNTGTQEYTKAQLDALLMVAKELAETYDLEDVLGHSDIAPKRKTDPGKQFPMEWIREEMFGKSTVKVTTTDVNLRKGAGTNFESFGVLKKDSEVNVLSKGDVWSEVFICASKQKGFIHNNYLK